MEDESTVHMLAVQVDDLSRPIATGGLHSQHALHNSLIRKSTMHCSVQYKSDQNIVAARRCALMSLTLQYSVMLVCVCERK